MFHRKSPPIHICLVKNDTELKEANELMAKLLSKANIAEPKIQFIHSIKDLKDLVTKIEQFNTKYDINMEK